MAPVSSTIAIAALSVSVLAAEVFGATIYQSASLGQIGISTQDLRSGVPQAVSISPNVFTGVRFQLTKPILVSHVGGHLVANTIDGGEGSAFAAIIALEGETDIPDSPNLSSPDVLGTTLISLPALSADMSGELSLGLEPGWYALVFGSGLFGANGFGGAVSNGSNLDNPAFIGGQPTIPDFWWVLPPQFTGQRFFIMGEVVPEPSNGLLLIAASVLALCGLRCSRIYNRPSAA